MEANLKTQDQDKVDREQNKEHLNSVKSWIVWGIAAFFYGYEFVLRTSPSVMQPELQSEWALDAGGLGFVVSLYYWAYAAMQVPAGMFLDRYGPRSVLTVAALICSLGTLGFAIADGPVIAGISRFMIGFGSAFALVGTFKLAGNWFTPNRFAFIAGLAFTFGAFGGTLGQGPLAYLIEMIGWRESLWIMVVVGLVNALLLWLVVHDHPHANRKEKKKEENLGIPLENTMDLWGSLKGVIKNPQSWIIGMYAAFIYIPIACFAELWGIPFLMKCCLCDRPTAGSILQMVLIGTTIGAPLFGWLSDKWQNRKMPLIIGCIGSLVCMLITLYVPNISQMIMSSLMFAMGIFLGSHLVLFALIRENNAPQAGAVSAGFGNFVCMMIPGIFQYIIGRLIDYFNAGEVIAEKASYSLVSLQYSLITVPIGIILALVLILFAKESHARQNHS